jgi:putative component of toxin-antitoxin plasmid stabilization module
MSYNMNVGTVQGPVQVRRTKEFATWLLGLRDKQGRAKILARIDRLEEGNPGKREAWAAVWSR